LDDLHAIRRAVQDDVLGRRDDREDELRRFHRVIMPNRTDRHMCRKSH